MPRMLVLDEKLVDLGAFRSQNPADLPFPSPSHLPEAGGLQVQQNLVRIHPLLRVFRTLHRNIA